MISNFGKYDEMKKLLSFSQPIIHSMNKEDILSDIYKHKYESYHTSAIILGDMIHDAQMLNQIPI